MAYLPEELAGFPEAVLVGEEPPVLGGELRLLVPPVRQVLSPEPAATVTMSE